MITLTDENFEREILNGERPVLVDFWSAHCFPCLLLSPILEKLAEEYKEKVIFAQFSIDQTSITVNKYEIDQVPTVLLFKEGKIVAGFVGIHPEPAIREWLEKNI